MRQRKVTGENFNKQPSPRRYKANLSVYGITQLHLRSPAIVALWSALFPGFGHLILSKYLKAYILILWEVFINTQSHLNCAILYSFTGRFESARAIIDPDWSLLYIPMYLFAIWDSYRTAVDLNHQYLLAAREDAWIKAFEMNTVEINHLDKKNPFIAVLWSALTPGLGYLYICRLPAFIIILIWWVTIVYFSKVLPAIQFTLLGEWEMAHSVINPGWFLYIPSIYFSAMYDSHLKTVENNSLFDWEQSKFLKAEYQDSSFIVPTNRTKHRGEAMYVISTFDHSIYLEEAITAIQMKGIAKCDILAVPLDKKNEEKKLFDTIHQSDGLSLLDIPMILASVFMLLGTIYGFVLKWGPIIWGLIGMLAGFGLGLLLKLFRTMKNPDRQQKNSSSEVVLIIECQESQSDMVKDTLWQHKAFGVRKLALGEETQ